MTGLYVHIPFCRSKCGYCGFASEARQEARIPVYLDALEREAAGCGRPRVDTVYVGGGTPTLLDVSSLERLLVLIQDRFDVSPDAEFSVEANPGTLDPAKAGLLRRRGVNRVSLGVQSFNEGVLKDLGRAHAREEAFAAAGILRAAGFDNVSLDLIFGYEGRGRAGLEQDLDEVARLAPEHVSLYALSIEPGSRFEKEGRPLPDPDRQAEAYLFVSERLRAMGYEHYEVSNFSRPGRACRHNLHYWRGGEYYGIGAAAHAHRGGVRSWNAPTLDGYLASPTTRAGSETLDPERRLRETVLLGLRTAEGADVPALEERFGVRLPGEFDGKVEPFVHGGLLVREGGVLKATLRGWLVLDELSGRLI